MTSGPPLYFSRAAPARSPGETNPAPPFVRVMSDGAGKPRHRCGWGAANRHAGARPGPRAGYGDGAAAWPAFEFSDTASGGLARERSVYVDQRPDLVLVFDRAAGAPSYQQLWHLDPGLTVTKVNRSYAVATAPDRRPGRNREPVIEEARNNLADLQACTSGPDRGTWARS